MGPRSLDAADELAIRGALLVLSAILCSLSPLISRMHSRLISDWRRTVSSKFFDTQVPRFVFSLLFSSRCALSRLRCNGQSLLLSSYLFKIGRIEKPSCSVCGHSSQGTSYFIQHCPATNPAPLDLWHISVFLRPLVQAQGSCPAFGARWSSAMPSSLGRGRVTTTTTLASVMYYQNFLETDFYLVNKSLKIDWEIRSQIKIFLEKRCIFLQNHYMIISVSERFLLIVPGGIMTS